MEKSIAVMAVAMVVALSPTLSGAVPTFTFNRPTFIRDCIMGAWSGWSYCDAQCGPGQRFRQRQIQAQPGYGGLPCGSTQESETCFQRPCQQDCVMGDWTAWTTCSASCDQGRRSRSRDIVVPAANYGQPCGPREEFEPCSERPCQQDCVMAEWTAWTACSASCDQGRRGRSRDIVVPAANYGRPCGPREEYEPCSERPCQQDCVMAEWSQWSRCSADCDGGSRGRNRDVLIPARNYGQPCGPREEFEPCNTQECPRDCAYTDWSPFTPCPACGQADRTRSRQIADPGNSAGVACDFGSLVETETCNLSPCPVDCRLSPWTSWTRCSASCDEGRRARTRNVVEAPQFGGLPCGPLEEWEACNEGPCAVDCQMGPWTQWSQCTAQCGQGKQSRRRYISVQPQNGGLACGPQEEWTVCNAGPCPQDCSYSDWAPWSPCPPCGQADRTRSRSITQQGLFGGVLCDFGSLSETETCLNSPCPIDCVQAPWSQWSACSASCDEGRRSRTRTTLTQPAFGGLQCGPAEDWAPCNNGPCAQDCQVTQWTQWSACSGECGPGRRSRTRSVSSPPLNGGAYCPPLEDWAECDNGPCRSPSVCDGSYGTRFIAEGCTPNFIICSNGQEHAKVCPGESRFDVDSRSCRLPADVRACRPANPPTPSYSFTSFFG